MRTYAHLLCAAVDVCDVCPGPRTYADVGADVAASLKISLEPQARPRPSAHTCPMFSHSSVLLLGSFYALARFRTPSFFFVTTGAAGANDDDEGAVFNKAAQLERRPLHR